MALRALSPQELANTQTLFASFMGSTGKRNKTVAQLLSIYRERSTTMDASEDSDDDLRVERFIDDMAGERWQDDLVMRIGVFDGEVRLIDGTHRALAYLACVDDGVSAERLPALHVDR
jgi:hypothetical protein